LNMVFLLKAFRAYYTPSCNRNVKGQFWGFSSDVGTASVLRRPASVRWDRGPSIVFEWREGNPQRCCYYSLRVGHGTPPCSDFRNMSGTRSEPESVLSEHGNPGVPLERNTVGTWLSRWSTRTEHGVQKAVKAVFPRFLHWPLRSLGRFNGRCAKRPGAMEHLCLKTEPDRNPFCVGPSSDAIQRNTLPLRPRSIGTRCRTCSDWTSEIGTRIRLNRNTALNVVHLSTQNRNTLWWNTVLNRLESGITSNQRNTTTRKRNPTGTPVENGLQDRSPGSAFSEHERNISGTRATVSYRPHCIEYGRGGRYGGGMVGVDVSNGPNSRALVSLPTFWHRPCKRNEPSLRTVRFFRFLGTVEM